MPNTLAYIVMLSWPLVVLALFKTQPLARAITVSIVAAYLLMPQDTSFDLPMVPSMNRNTLPAFAVFVMCIFVAGVKVPILPKSMTGRVLVVLFLVTPTLTMLTNTEPVVAGPLRVPGLRIYDVLSMTAQLFMGILIFFVARAQLATAEAHRELVRVLMIAGAAYGVAVAFELRFSPQMHNLFYGFFPHDWFQHVRYGGYRPIVFLNHGLWLALFMMIATLAAVISWRASPPAEKKVPRLLTFYLAALLVLCKSFGALIYALAVIPVMALATRRGILIVATLMALLAITYPALRVFDLVPTDRLVALAGEVSTGRAASLDYRFYNEDRLLARAMDKPLFGWGSWGRGSVFDQWSGQLISTVDGKWIGTFNSHGWFGYIGEFGLLTLPIFMLWRHRKIALEHMSLYTAGLVLMLGVNLVDLLPNATRTPIMLLVAGSLLGYAESLLPERGKSRGPAPAGAPPPGPAPEPAPQRTGAAHRGGLRTGAPRRTALPESRADSASRGPRP